MRRKVLALGAPLVAALSVVVVVLVLLLAGCWLQQQLLLRYQCHISALHLCTALLAWLVPGSGLLIGSLFYECRRLRRLLNE
jgi:hypothetical protein